MSPATEFVRIARGPFDRLFDALTDKARCERTMLLLLLGYAATWTLYDSISNASHDLHPDMTELIAWARDLSFGYIKHPPLSAFLVRLWFSIVPQFDWTFYLLAMLMPASALWIVWRLSADYLDIEKRVLAVALLMLVPFYSFLALTFNANTLLLPAWAATTFWFLRSYETRSRFYSLLAGIGAGACMLGKYWSIFLLAGLVIAALADRRRLAYFRSSAPWITVAAGLIVFSPNLIWLYQHDFLPFQYADARHGATSFGEAVARAATYLSGLAAYVAVPVLIILLVTRPRWTTIADMVWPADSRRRLAATAFWATLLLPALGALVGDFLLTPLWQIPGLSLLPIVLLSPPAIEIQPVVARRVLGAGLAVGAAMLLVSPVVAITNSRDTEPLDAQARLLAAEVERDWHQMTAEPLRFVGCNGAFDVIAYAKDRPYPLPQRYYEGRVADKIYAEGHNWTRRAVDEPPSFEAELTRSGMALACSASATEWLDASKMRVARGPAARRFDVELSRNFLGTPGKPEPYVIFIIPPAH